MYPASCHLAQSKVRGVGLVRWQAPRSPKRPTTRKLDLTAPTARSPQTAATHFQQCFQIAKRAGWTSDKVSLEHVPFGVVTGEDGGKLKTRSGETVHTRPCLTSNPALPDIMPGPA